MLDQESTDTLVNKKVVAPIVGCLGVGYEQQTIGQRVETLVSRFKRMWWECPTGMPSFRRTFTTREQSIRERYLDQFLDALTTELDRTPRTKSDRLTAQKRILSAFGDFARTGLGFEERHVHALFSRGLPEAVTEFAQRSRRFDSTISGSEIFQASRNVWTMNGLQLLLGLPVQVTPCIFAYSMLYPYSDNYLDDPAVSLEAKEGFNDRFALRLVGDEVRPANERERQVFDLVGMIEDEYERTTHPEVYQSLLAIHRAQVGSVRLLCDNPLSSNVDVLGIGLEKGGCSVLADGYLVAGRLTSAQEEFLFGWGAFLQFVDDLQDVKEDSEGGLMTAFSQAARSEPLDRVTSRTIHFGSKVLELDCCFDAPGTEPLKELKHLSASQLMINAAGRVERLYTRAYRKELEKHSPFRFSSLRKRKRRLVRKRVSFLKLMEAFAAAGASKYHEA